MGTLVGLRMSLFGVAWTAFQVSARVLRNASEKYMQEQLWKLRSSVRMAMHTNLGTVD